MIKKKRLIVGAKLLEQTIWEVIEMFGRRKEVISQQDQIIMKIIFKVGLSPSKDAGKGNN